MVILKLTGHPHWFDVEKLNYSRSANSRYFPANVIFPEDNSIWSGAFFVEPAVESGVFESSIICVHFMPDVKVEEKIQHTRWFYIAKGPNKIGKFEIISVEYRPDSWKPTNVF